MTYDLDMAALAPEPPVLLDEVLTIEKSAILKEILLAKIRSAFAQGYVYKLQNGSSVQKLAERGGWTVKKFRTLMLVPDDITIPEIAEFTYALDMRIEFNLSAAV